MKNAVIYARFSSHAQNEQSIEGQLAECYNFAQRNDLRITHEYIDRALTGATDKRPEFLQMIEDSKRKGFQYILVYQLDRFARNRYDSATYKAKLKRNGVRVLSAKENITDDASGILIEGVLESMAEYYSAELSQKVKRGIAMSASKCKYFGIYTFQGTEIKGGVPQIIDEQLFEEVQAVLRKYAAAPSRGKAVEEYILSVKLICGLCGHKMTGVSGTSRNKTMHNYYKCGGTSKQGCRKRAVRKQFIEDEVINAIVGAHGVLTGEFIDMVAAETYLLIQDERNDSEIKRIEGVIADNQAAINNLMQALMHGKIANTILAQIEKLENENAELTATIESEKALQIDYSYADIRKWLEYFRTLDYSKPKNRKALIDTFIYRVVLYDDKMKVLFNLKGGQKNGLLLNLIFPDYPDGNGGEDGNSTKEKETANAISQSGCSYTPVYGADNRS